MSGRSVNRMTMQKVFEPFGHLTDTMQFCQLHGYITVNIPAMKAPS